MKTENWTDGMISAASKIKRTNLLATMLQSAIEQVQVLADISVSALHALAVCKAISICMLS